MIAGVVGCVWQLSVKMVRPNLKVRYVFNTKHNEKYSSQIIGRNVDA